MTDQEKSWYIAGPMSHIPQFNFPAFDYAAAQLREAGIQIISPAELDNGAVRDAAMASEDGAPGSIPVGHTWGTLLARDVELIADRCLGIIFLDGWERSRGARLEAHVGLLCEHQFMKFEPMNGTLYPYLLTYVSPGAVREVISRA